MSCKLTSGRLVECKDVIAGIQGIYIENWDELVGLTLDSQSGLITDYAESGSTVYFFELKGSGNNFAETINTNRDNGTTFFTQTLTINLTKLTSEMSNALKVLASGRFRVFVHTNNGETFLMGMNRGVDLTAGTSQTGGALGDLNGYSGLTFVAEEKDPVLYVKDSTVADPFAVFTKKPTVVSE